MMWQLTATSVDAPPGPNGSTVFSTAMVLPFWLRRYDRGQSIPWLIDEIQMRMRHAGVDPRTIEWTVEAW